MAKIIRNKYLPFKGFNAVNLFGIIFIRNNTVVTDRMINHERIHTRQMVELLFIGFYVIYFLEWLFNLFKYGSFMEAYMSISFEKEAYANELNMEYLKERTFFSFLKYLENNSKTKFK